jgi:hypothetical protein
MRFFAVMRSNYLLNQWPHSMAALAVPSLIKGLNNRIFTFNHMKINKLPIKGLPMHIPKQKSGFSVDNTIFTGCCMLIGRIV